MRITAVETLLAERYPHLCYVRVHTDDGLIGLGESFFAPDAIADEVHLAVAPTLLGRDPHSVDDIWVGLEPAGEVGWRARSAADVALWDLAGQTASRPLYALLGGPVRDRVPVYNTCAGYDQPGWEIGGPNAGPYEDYAATFARPEALAASLLAEGFRALKVWPFEISGPTATPEALARGLEPIARIRRAHGAEMTILVDGGRWTPAVACAVATVLEEHAPYWIEDFVPAHEPDAWRTLAASTSLRLAGGEDLAGGRGFADLLEAGLEVPIFDPGWVGGVSGARTAIALARGHGRPFCPHDCTGPVSFVVGAHLSIAASDVLMQEVVRAYLHGAYPEIVDGLPRVADGHVFAPDGTGLGVRLTDYFVKQAVSRVSPA